MRDLQGYPLNLNLINNVEPMVDFLGIKVFISDTSPKQKCAMENPQFNKTYFMNYKH